MGKNLSKPIFFNKFDYLAIIIILLIFGVSLYYYNILPNELATHWDINGEADGFGNKFMGLFLIPIITAFIYLLLRLIPIIAPHKKNIAKFIDTYSWFMIILLVFLTYVHFASIAFNLGYLFDMTNLIMTPMALLIFYSGVLIERAEQNYFIGIRTPWTLASKSVWEKTHKLGGKLFKYAALLILIGKLTPWPVYVFLISILGSTIIPIVYSYLEFKKE